MLLLDPPVGIQSYVSVCIHGDNQGDTMALCRLGQLQVKLNGEGIEFAQTTCEPFNETGTESHEGYVRYVDTQLRVSNGLLTAFHVAPY